jgi:protoporphyrinogen oxidase
LGTSVVSIDAEKKEVTTGSGDIYRYEHLLSTMPVTRLTEVVKQVPSAVAKVAAGLRHSSSNIVGVGLKGRPPEDVGTKCWMYFPESNCPFYRVTVFSNYSPHNVPDPDVHYSLMTETSESPKKRVNLDRLKHDTVEGLKNTKLITSADEVVSVWSYRAEHGYPTPSLERDAILDTVIPFLDKLGVYSRGRFGGWKYEVSNQDHSFMQGVEWVDWIRHGKVEETYKVHRAIDISTHRTRKQPIKEDLHQALSLKSSAKSA